MNRSELLTTLPGSATERSLLEDWLPVLELGIESYHERRVPGDLPSLFMIHLWWARRPIGAALTIQLAALLPPFTQELVDEVDGLEQRLKEITFLPADDLTDRYRNWVLWMAGIRGDNIAGQARFEDGHTKRDASFGHRKAWKTPPENKDLALLQRLLRHRWGQDPTVVDPTAGGGTIPYAATRLGVDAVGNDLNPVAVASMEAALPIAISPNSEELLSKVREHGNRLLGSINARLSPYFPQPQGAEEDVYLFANTVACPRTGGPVILSPNWWLLKKGKKRRMAVKPIPRRNADGEPDGFDFEIQRRGEIDFDPDAGTWSGGDAVSPWDDKVVDSEYIKEEAQAGRMWHTLYAVRVRRNKQDWWMRAPEQRDYEALEAAEQAVEDSLDRWIHKGVIPDEEVPVGADTRPLQYGRPRWRDLYSRRQLLTHATFVETWREQYEAAKEELAEEEADKVYAALASMHAKALDYNNISTVWTPGKPGVTGGFQGHNFAFKPSFAERNGAGALWRQGLNRELLRNLERLVRATRTQGGGFGDLDDDVRAPDLTLTCRSASDLGLASGSVECVNIDPPYYDNVMYAELSDFFYVWEKRTLGLIRPGDFALEETDKDQEAVANEARFSHLPRKKRKAMADLDYQAKMRDIFSEARRVMRDDGVMVVWFTHKRADAWDTLGTAIMDAGFTITTSWPVETESSISLHQAEVNAAKSTIILVCRKRPDRDDDHLVFYEDIESDLRAAARTAAVEFEPVVGSGGVDLLLSTYGPTLGVLSANWPVVTSQADAAGDPIPLKPEQALDVARAEVARLRIGRLVGHDKRFDPTTDFILIAWDTYRSKGFPYDEARKLALGVGADVDRLVSDKVLSKSSGNVSLISPSDRVRRRIPEEGPFGSTYDAICVMLRLYEHDGAGRVRSWLVERGYDAGGEFQDAVTAYAHAVPRVKGKDGWTIPEAELVDGLAQNVPALNLTLPEAESEVEGYEQGSLL